ncbi:MAG: bifunctional riboflavin kinase/FAD synthetase [Armatimonadetes bacterium]|nr:bifunctional riboflavin kinase/FAD synthetase [Armatimonadota bacterium]NIM24640.1 bifunctional riboflavin kinase/FAD synthetase [Armatimonadota bacterium]NIM68519.1 bifunctional riboflavin kinase/FAD synthetase [Armatimonadota bacterium]NIM76901.1 bifunctional riboflavin kinase/FAD synthetase [Armatimonadota bacterium]NIN06713.1 bifunctional riboflavin kinase/FAD synthetase [Armatimonadota bacterium]
MKSFFDLQSLDIKEECCLTLGVFDGVHVGHQRLLRSVVDISRARGLTSLVLTFDPHPEVILSPKGGPPLLTCTEEKLALFKELGLRIAVVARFEQALANMSARDFVKHILVGKLRAKHIVAGPELAFGKGRQGNACFLMMLREEMGFDVEVMEEIEREGEIVSSTAIRQAVLSGDMGKAAKMLGRPYQLSGPVVTGTGRGRKLGFPTGNLRPPADKALPPDGVYACVVSIGDDKMQAGESMLNHPQGHTAVVYIGSRPTFGPGERLIEAHICDKKMQLDEKNLGIHFFIRLRGDITFSSSKELVRQMAQDTKQALEVMGKHFSSE